MAGRGRHDVGRSFPGREKQSRRLSPGRQYRRVVQAEVAHSDSELGDLGKGRRPPVRLLSIKTLVEEGHPYHFPDILDFLPASSVDPLPGRVHQRGKMENGEVSAQGEVGVEVETMLNQNGGGDRGPQGAAENSNQLEVDTATEEQSVSQNSEEIQQSTVVHSSSEVISQSSSKIVTQSSSEVISHSSSEVISQSSSEVISQSQTEGSVFTDENQQEINEVQQNSCEQVEISGNIPQIEIESPPVQCEQEALESTEGSEGTSTSTGSTVVHEDLCQEAETQGPQVVSRTSHESSESDFRKEVTECEEGVRETEVVRTFVHRKVVTTVVESSGDSSSTSVVEQTDNSPGDNHEKPVPVDGSQGEEKVLKRKSSTSSSSSSSTDGSHTKEEEKSAEEKEVDTTQESEIGEGGASPLQSPHIVPLSPEPQEGEDKKPKSPSTKPKGFFGLFSRKSKDKGEKKEKKDKDKKKDKESTLEKKKKSALKKAKKDKESESPESPHTPKKVTIEASGDASFVQIEKVEAVSEDKIEAVVGSQENLEVSDKTETDVHNSSAEEIEVKESTIEAVDAKASEQQIEAQIEFVPIEVEEEKPDDKENSSEAMAASEELAGPLAQEKLAQGGSPPGVKEVAPGVEHREEFIVVADRPKSMDIPDSTKSNSQSPSPRVITPSGLSPETPSTSSQLKVPSPYAPRPDDGYDGAVARSHRSSVDSGTGSDPSRAPGHFVVVAIDFGTTFSGYAFSFTRDPESIHMMRKWEGGDPGVINQKTPTTLLLKPDGTFHSFGFSARDFFHDLDPNEAKKWLYFEKFKMALHYNAELNKDTTLKASNGKLVSALTVFAHALRFFKEHALQELTDQSSTKIINDDVRWVITVPAIWKAPAKQFMRQAAYKAGIASQEYPDQLLIALEPEAASIYCRKLRLHQLVPEKPVKQPLTPNKRGSTPEPLSVDKISDDLKSESSTPPATPDSLQASVYPIPENTISVGSEVQVPGTRYMVVDCGGGTVDITVHEMESRHGNLKELYKATGGPYGSVGVDLEFEKLLIAIFGAEFIDAFKYKRPAGWVDLMIAFESRKRAANPYKNNPLNVSLPFSFIDYYKKYKSSQVESAIRKYSTGAGERYVQWSSQGMLRLYPDAMNRLFAPTLESIRRAVGDILNNPSVKNIKYLFLVGGFAESPVLQHTLRKEFGHILRIIIPQDVGLTILKGAVCFGLDPTVVNVRKSRLTYGVGVLNRFVPSKHPTGKKVSKDGIDWCTDVFDKFVMTDQSVALGDSVLRTYTPAKPGQKSSIINIYCSERSDAMFITDRGVKKCGTLVLDLTDMQYQQVLPKRREIQARMVFGDTEIKASALDVATGKCVKSGIDFLNK